MKFVVWQDITARTIELLSFSKVTEGVLFLSFLYSGTEVWEGSGMKWNL